MLKCVFDQKKKIRLQFLLTSSPVREWNKRGFDERGCSCRSLHTALATQWESPTNPGRMGVLTNVGVLYAVLATYYVHVHMLLIFLS